MPTDRSRAAEPERDTTAPAFIVRIIMKSGAEVRLTVKEFTITRRPISEELARIDWLYPDDTDEAIVKPLHIAADEIAAIVREPLPS